MSDVLPGDAGYVFAAYMVFLALLLIYLGILGARFQRINRDVAQLTEEVESCRGPKPASRPATEADEAQETTSV
jgi:hypothetical protein